MQTVVMDITPAQAKALLARQRWDADPGLPPNRRVDPSRVQRLMEAIMRGEWLVTHQGIALDRDNRLLDGQHRLQAIVASGRTVRMNVSFDVDPAAFAVIDNGKPRGVAFAIGVSSRDASTALAALRVMQGPVKPTPQQVRGVLEWLGPPLERLSERCGTVVRVRSSAPVRLAAAARILQGEPAASHAAAAYRSFVLMDDDLPPIGRSMLKQVVNGETRPQYDWVDFTARCWIMFDPARASHVKLIIKQPTAAYHDLRAVLHAAAARDPVGETMRATGLSFPDAVVRIAGKRPRPGAPH